MPIGQTPIDEFIKRGKLLSEDVAWFNAFDTYTKKQIIQLIQTRWTDEGTDEDGKIIGLYSLSTEFITKGRKKEGDPYDLNMFGDFRRSMYVLVFLNEIFIGADGQKGDENLFTKWNAKEKIIGLTDEDFEKVKETVKEKYFEYIDRTLFGAI